MYERINIAKDFGTVLGGRWKRLCSNSGEEFYDTVLLPAYKSAKSANVKLIIDLDGTRGYPHSFLDQSFGELARKYGVTEVQGMIMFKTETYKWIVEYIKEEIWDK